MGGHGAPQAPRSFLHYGAVPILLAPLAEPLRKIGLPERARAKAMRGMPGRTMNTARNVDQNRVPVIFRDCCNENTLR